MSKELLRLVGLATLYVLAAPMYLLRWILAVVLQDPARRAALAAGVMHAMSVVRGTRAACANEHLSEVRLHLTVEPRRAMPELPRRSVPLHAMPVVRRIGEGAVMLQPISMTSILSGRRGSTPLPSAWCSTVLLPFPTTPMITTVTAVLPDVNPVGVLEPIPDAAWDPAITAAERELGVRLEVERHARSFDEIPHTHFSITADEDDLEAAVPEVTRLIAKVLNAHTKSVTLPEGR